MNVHVARISSAASLAALTRLARYTQEALSATCSSFARQSGPVLHIRSDCAKPAAFIQPAAQPFLSSFRYLLYLILRATWRAIARVASKGLVSEPN